MGRRAPAACPWVPRGLPVGRPRPPGRGPSAGPGALGRRPPTQASAPGLRKPTQASASVPGSQQGDTPPCLEVSRGIRLVPGRQLGVDTTGVGVKKEGGYTYIGEQLCGARFYQKSLFDQLCLGIYGVHYVAQLVGTRFWVAILGSVQLFTRARFLLLLGAHVLAHVFERFVLMIRSDA